MYIPWLFVYAHVYAWSKGEMKRGPTGANRGQIGGSNLCATPSHLSFWSCIHMCIYKQSRHAHVHILQFLVGPPYRSLEHQKFKNVCGQWLAPCTTHCTVATFHCTVAMQIWIPWRWIGFFLLSHWTRQYIETASAICTSILPPCYTRTMPIGFSLLCHWTRQYIETANAICTNILPMCYIMAMST